MKTAPQVKGWCPGALRPMLSGDGWVVRVRPYCGRLTNTQAAGIAELAALHGNGMLDLSSRGNIQIRGVSEVSHTPLIGGLRDLSLIDDSADVEARRNILQTPFWQTGDKTELVAGELTRILAANEAPALPGKFGFGLDTGNTPVLQNASADIRLERDVNGELILVADGFDKGKRVTVQTAATDAVALAHWFMNARTAETRMAALLASGIDVPNGFDAPRQIQDYAPKPIAIPQGSLVALAFGQMSCETLVLLSQYGGLRMTPWRMLLVERTAQLPQIDGIITDPDDPVLRVVACTGAPDCTQGLGTTRDVARRLAIHVPEGQLLHVAGCAKGCAHPKPADLTITATHTGYDLIRNGRAFDAPDQTNLTPDTLIKAI